MPKKEQRERAGIVFVGIAIGLLIGGIMVSVDLPLPLLGYAGIGALAVGYLFFARATE